MQTAISTQPWAIRQLNQSGIRRLKIVDAGTVSLLLFQKLLVPLETITLYEFIFPSDMSCVASFERQTTESGSVFWNQSLSFSLPHLSDQLLQWADDHKQTLWLAITEDYNGTTRILGGASQGLDMSFQASTGSRPKDANPMSFSFNGQQLAPFLSQPHYDDELLFNSSAGFSYGFSIGFGT